MQVFNASTLPVYLPYDKAPVPFGDPITDVAFTSASPCVITATGYSAPANNDAVQFSVTTAGNSLPAPLVAGTTYYVIGTSVNGNSFSISTQKNGAAAAVATTGGAGTGTATIHLVSNQVDGVSLPFKPGNSAVLMNLGTNQAALYGASDTTTTYGNPQGPGTWNLIATALGGTAQIITLSYDWIKVSASGTLVLLQN